MSQNTTSFSPSTADSADDGAHGTGTTRVKRGLADTLKGGVICLLYTSPSPRDRG